MLTNANFNAEQSLLFKQGNRLEYWTMVWNLLSLAFISFALELHPSAALLGMQIISLIHLFASAVVLSQIAGVDRNREHLALKVIAFAYGAATLYLLAKAIIGLMIGKRYEENLVGILWLGISYFVMWTLSRKKRRIGHALQNQIFIHISDMNRFDAYLTLVAASGLLLNAFCGFHWADPLAALILVGYNCEQGVAAWKASIEHARLAELEYEQSEQHSERKSSSY